MVDQKSSEGKSFVVQAHQALIAIPETEDGHEVTRYSIDEEAADQAMTMAVTQDALQVIGAWRDLDWQEMEDALDRIRHESVPTPPIEL